jgi:hypothetical protein
MRSGSLFHSLRLYLFGVGGAANKAALPAKPRLLLSGSDHDNLDTKGNPMSTPGIAQPAETAAQKTVAAVSTDIMDYLTPESQIVATIAQAVHPLAGTSVLSNTFSTINNLTGIASQLGGNVGAYASLASLIEQIVAAEVGVFKNASGETVVPSATGTTATVAPTAAQIVPNAHPRFLFKLAHPNKAHQEEAAAAALVAAKPAA